MKYLLNLTPFSRFFSGFAAGGIAGGNIQSALQGALTAGITFGLASGFDLHGAATFGEAKHLGQIALHAAMGCASSAMAGGSCKSGAISGGVAAFASPLMPANRIGRLLGSSIVGAIASALSGGKAANGALTAAFSYLFNEVAAARHEELRKGDTGFHKYSEFSGCGDAAYCNRADINAALNFLPSMTPMFGIGGSNYSFAGPGVVESYGDSSGILNVTTSAHALKWGVVARNAEYRDGQWGILTTGMGYGILPRQNEYLASVFWRRIDVGVFEHASNARWVACVGKPAGCQ